jgi:hypothetical protein
MHCSRNKITLITLITLNGKWNNPNNPKWTFTKERRVGKKGEKLNPKRREERVVSERITLGKL